MFATLRFTTRAHRHECDHKRRCWIAYLKFALCDRLQLEVQLFVQLAPSSRFVVFVRLELPARKLPQPAVSLVLRALANEKPSLTLQYRRNDANAHYCRFEL